MKPKNGLSRLKKLQRDRDELDGRIAKERAVFASNLGAVIIKVMGEEIAERFGAILASAVKKSSRDDVCAALDALSANNAKKPATNGVKRASSGEAASS